jgi:hypothetical protein
MVRKAGFIIVFLSAAAAAAPSVDFSGNKMLVSCRSIRDGNGSGLPGGVCIGVVRTALAVGALLPPDLKFCAPKGTTTDQGNRVLVKYMEDHPGETQDDIVGLALDAFRATWPCPL